MLQQKGKKLGLLSEKDILKRINIVDNKILLDQKLLLENYTNQKFITTDSFSDIRKVAKVLAKFHIDAMPVMKDERLVGIVTRGDILKSFTYI